MVNLHIPKDVIDPEQLIHAPVKRSLSIVFLFVTVTFFTA